MFDYWCVQMVYTEILVFQNRVISKNVYKIAHVCPPHTAQKVDHFFGSFALTNLAIFLNIPVYSRLTPFSVLVW